MTSSVQSLALTLLLLAPIATAETIRFDPPNVTAHHSVDAIVTGSWPNGCVPSVKSVSINGSTILLSLDARPPLGVFCIQLVSPYTRTFHLDVLPAGNYTVAAFADYGDSITALARTTLIVRDAETLNIEPYAVPVSGGGIVIGNSSFVSGDTLTIGGVTVPASTDVDGLLIANAPPHSPGAVDVVVTSQVCLVPCGLQMIATAALIYYDPAAADPAVFEPMLFPLSFQGPGAFGSQWTTESFIHASTPAAFFRDALPCAGCSNSIQSDAKQLTNDSNPWGHVLYAMRGTTGSLDLASRIRDTSRQGQTAGTEVPVVHGSDFRGQLRFLNVPVDSRYRVTLRLWAFSDSPFAVAVDSIPAQQIPLSLTSIPGSTMKFGSADVTALLTRASGNPTSLMVIPTASPLLSPPIWGMLSITNNDTQQVTIISPQ
ncbi:MAG TPA: hypothetical protein VLC46_19795 [Thermoanaerobaculia bacterium]|jgi:hypothetical protein|nr:hypothetical protein [Thermoanaerobaculia bacterium]